MELLHGDRSDDFVGNATAFDHLRIEHPHSAVQSRPSPVPVTRQPELAHDENVQRRVQFSATSAATGTPPRGSPSTRPLAVCIIADSRCEKLACFYPVAEIVFS